MPQSKQTLNPQNGNIIIKFKKNYTELITASGIVLPNVEQDMNIAEVVAIPEERKYEHKVYDTLGTPIRNEDGSIKEAIGFVTVNVGDKVLIERRTHAEYDSGPERYIIPHCVHIPVEWEVFEDSDKYDYYFIRFEDVLGMYSGDDKENYIHGELFSIAEAKPIKLQSR